MNTQTAQAELASPQMQAQNPSVPATTPSASPGFTSPQVSQIAGPGFHQSVPTGTAQLTGQYIAPTASAPQSYQQPPGQPSQYHHGPTGNGQLTGQYTAPLASTPQSYQQLSSQPSQYHHGPTGNGQLTGQYIAAPISPPQTYQQPQPQRQPQWQTKDLPPIFPGEKDPGSVHVQRVVTAQPELVKGMDCAGMTEEELKKQRRAEQMRKARHCCGQTCIICGQVCIVTASVMMAVCSVASCLLSCLPGDSPGIMGGGGGGFDMSMPN